MHPNNPAMPLFVYGIFQPGELAWLRLRDRVESAQRGWRVAGQVRERDGLAILDVDGPGEVAGWVLVLREDAVAAAYESIADLEPEHQYRWTEATAIRDGDQLIVNVLAGKRPGDGSTTLEGPWAGRTDPLLTAGLDVIEDMVDEVGRPSPVDVEPLLRLQATYLLLFTAIERYASLRYGLGESVRPKLKKVAQEPAFATALAEHVTKVEEVRRATKPDSKERLDPQAPSRSMDYYYQLRSNISHRGKAAVVDFDRLARATTSLLEVFREVVSAAFADARHDDPPGSS